MTSATPPDFLTRCMSSGLVSSDVLRLVLPLTPSGNEVLSWCGNGKIKWAFPQHKARTIVDVRAAVYHVLGYTMLGNNRVWAERVSLCAIRCGIGRCDVDNVVSGMKYAIDSLVDCGVFPNDDPKHFELGLIQSRSKSEWGNLIGPATHLFICKINGNKREDYEKVFDKVFFFFEMED